MQKLLSIIIPAYNMEKYLPLCLDSLLVSDSRLITALDVLVINDGSTDNTKIIAQEYATRFPGVFRVINKPNGHYGSCINRGLAEAVGTYVKILDADDTFDKVGLEKLILKLDELSSTNSFVDLIWTDVRTTDENRSETGKIKFSLPASNELTLDDLTNMPQDRCMHAATYRRGIFDNLNYHQSEGIAYTDTEWIFLPMTAVKSAIYLPFVVYNYMLGRADQSMNAKVVGRQLAMLRQVFFSRLDTYCKHRDKWSSESLRYAQSELSRGATCLYRTHLQNSIFGNLKILRGIDKRIRSDIPELRNRIGETDVVFTSTPHPISYGKMYAQHPIFRIPIAIALKIKQMI